MVKLDSFMINEAQEELIVFHLTDFNFCEKERCYVVLQWKSDT
jgi:hypothetical protein